MSFLLVPFDRQIFRNIFRTPYQTSKGNCAQIDLLKQNKSQNIFIQPNFCFYCHEPFLNSRTGEAFTTLLAGASEIKFRPLFTEGQFCSSAKK